MRPRPDLSWQSVSLDATLSGPFAPDPRPRVPCTSRTCAPAAQRSGPSRPTSRAMRNKCSCTPLWTACAFPANPGRAGGGAPDDSGRGEAGPAGAARDLHPRASVDRSEGQGPDGGGHARPISLDLPDLAPLASMAGADVQGHAKLELRAAEGCPHGPGPSPPPSDPHRTPPH